MSPILRVKIPKEFVAKVMGQSGVTIKKIQKETKSKLAFEGPNTGEYLNGRVLSIKAFTPEDIQIARKWVEEICGSENVQDETDKPPEQNFYVPRQFSPKENLSDNSNNHQSDISFGELVEDEFLIPADLVAHVVGREEGNLKSIKASLSLTSIEMLMPCKLPTGQTFCPVSICGSAKKVEEAKVMLQRMLNCFVPKPSVRPPVPISPNATFLEEYQAPNQVLQDMTKDEVPVQKALSPVQEASLTSGQEVFSPIQSSPVRQAPAPVCNIPAQHASATAPISPVRESPAPFQSNPDLVQNISVQESTVLVQKNPQQQAPDPVLKTLETPVRKNPIPQVPVHKAITTAVQEHPAVIQESPVHETTTLAPKAIAVGQSTELPVQATSPVKETTITNRPLERSLKRPLATKGQGQEDGFKAKMQKKQLKVFEEQQEYFKKRSLLVEKQIEQIEMENYAKKTQLGLPASLCINYNGQTIHLNNEFADENMHQIK